jgi:hypothetical protein
LQETILMQPTDSALALALDRDSVREKTRDGRLSVKVANISKANVCPYRGREIPGWESLGLAPERIYNLLRDPEELKKAAPSLNGVQLLRKHIPVNAEDHQPYDTVGSLGTDAEFDGTYLTNSLFVNAQDAIDGIESGKKRELSAGYHYTPDMTPGKFDGKGFDGVMRDIVFNHVALVEDGRAGPDVVVGDSMENVMKPTRFAAVVLSATAAAVAPLLAMDSKVSLSTDAFKKLTPKNFKDSKAALLAGVRTAIDGKLRKGLALDASMAGLAKAIDAFESLEEPNDNEIEEVAAVEPTAVPEDKPDTSTFDAEPLKNFLREKGMGEDDIMKACDMMPKPALDSEESDEEKKDEEKKPNPFTAKDAEPDKDKDKKDMIDKPAMDAALKAHGDQIAKQVRETERGIRTALADVKPWVGELPPAMAFDTAADVYRHTAGMLNIEGAKTLHADALLPIIKAQPKPGAKNESADRREMAMDASVIDKAHKIAPGLANISTVL